MHNFVQGLHLSFSFLKEVPVNFREEVHLHGRHILMRKADEVHKHTECRGNRLVHADRTDASNLSSHSQIPLHAESEDG